MTVMPAPPVTLTSDLLTQKSSQLVYERKYICDQNWMKFLSLVLKIMEFVTL